METMSKRKHLSVFGVGPLYGAIVIIVTIIAILLKCKGLLQIGNVPILKIPFMIIGSVLIVYAIVLYFWALLQAQIFRNIESNQLVTNGVYSKVRNPIYSAIMIACTGVILFADNLLLLVLPFIFWIFMTLLMKATEEKWLLDMYGEKYAEYCKNVNRCIPWFSKK